MKIVSCAHKNCKIMKNLFKLVLVLGLINGLYSCQNDSGTTITEDRPYDEVYLEDIAEIEDFLDTHYVTVDSDYNTTFTQIPDGGTQVPVSAMPELDFKEVDLHDITYKVYYLNLREGTGENITRVDSSFVSYKGFSFAKTTVDAVDTYTQTVFDSKQSPIWLSLDEVIRGWAEIIPKFKTGTFSAMTDGSISFNNFGAGVIFIPSGLAYFSSGSSNIPSYSPLIFNFKLHNLRRRDHDRDGILSMHEYGPNFDADAIDTDGDGRPDYIDVDDDADGVLTKTERSFTYLDGSETKTGYYPFNGALVDDPSTPYDDTKGIPSCSADFTTATRLRRHLDPSCRN